jgi:hypothetical protein
MFSAHGRLNFGPEYINNSFYSTFNYDMISANGDLRLSDDQRRSCTL